MSTLTESAAGQPSGDQASGNSTPSSAPSSAPTGNWRDSLPEDIKTSPALQSFTDVPALAKSYLNAQSLIGKKGVIPPGEKASDEEWGNFYDTLGRPPLDKYEVKPPEGVQVDEGTIKWFKENSHKLGIMPKQAQKLLEGYLELEKTTVSQRQQAKDAENKAQLEALKKEWGAGYDKQVALAKLVVKEGGEEFASYLDKSGLGNDVQLIKAIAKFASKYATEDQLRGDGSGKFGKTPAELDKEIEALRHNPAFADSSHGQNKWVMSQFEDLMRQRFPT